MNKTPDELRQWYTNMVARNAKWKQEHKPEVKQHNHDYWKDHKAEINAMRRQKYAQARAAVPADKRRPIGRPKSGVEYAIVAKNVMEQQQTVEPLYLTGFVKAGEKKEDEVIGNVPDWLPEKARKSLGAQVKMPWNPKERYYNKLGNWWLENSGKKEGGISDDTKKGYYGSARAAMIGAFNMPPDVAPQGKVYDPLPIVEWLLKNTQPDDVWKLLKWMEDDSEKKSYISAINGYTKSMCAILAAWIMWALSENYPFGDTERVAKFITIERWCQIISRRAVGAKQSVFDYHATQTKSERVEQNEMEYKDWEKLALQYIYETYTKSSGKPKKGKKIEELRDAAAIACYTFIPPVRNDWASMEVNTKVPTDFKDERNVLVFESETKAVAHWSKFKNSYVFKNELPLKQDLPKELASILYWYYKERKGGKYLFPRNLQSDKSEMMTNGEFGDVLMSAGENFTPKIPGSNKPKRIGASILRIMYITYYHDTTKGVKDLPAVLALMKKMHQSNLEVHLGYIKRRAKKEDHQKLVALSIAQDLMIQEEQYKDDDEDIPVIAYDEEDKKEIEQKTSRYGRPIKVVTVGSTEPKKAETPKKGETPKKAATPAKAASNKKPEAPKSAGKKK